jgi:hypothetical protein
MPVVLALHLAALVPVRTVVEDNVGAVPPDELVSSARVCVSNPQMLSGAARLNTDRISIRNKLHNGFRIPFNFINVTSV